VQPSARSQGVLTAQSTGALVWAGGTEGAAQTNAMEAYSIATDTWLSQVPMLYSYGLCIVTACYRQLALAGPC
jgi:hypothetical protein